VKGCGHRLIPSIIPAVSEGEGLDEHHIKLQRSGLAPDLNPGPSKHVGMELMEPIAGKFHVVWQRRNQARQLQFK